MRGWLPEKGVNLDTKVTTFYEGEKNEFQFGGKADIQIIIDAEKFGLWKGFNIITHAEYNFRNSINERIGTFLPQNTALYFPGIKRKNRFDITSLYFQQKTAKNKTIIAGKINMIDIAAVSKFIGGAGVENFEHIGFVALLYFRNVILYKNVSHELYIWNL